MCCRSALKDALKGVAVLTALGGLAPLLGGLKELVSLGRAAATDPSVSWLSLLFVFFGGLLLLVGLSASLGSWWPLSTPSRHCMTGVCLVLLPLEILLVWAYQAHPSQLRWLAARDQTYLLTAVLDWVDAHASLAGGLAVLWLLLQAAAVLLGAVYSCCPDGRRYKHPWDRYWEHGEGAREPLLPRSRAESGPASPRAPGYHTPPSRFQSPYTSPARFPQVVVPEPPTAPPAPLVTSG